MLIPQESYVVQLPSHLAQFLIYTYTHTQRHLQTKASDTLIKAWKLKWVYDAFRFHKFD